MHMALLLAELIALYILSGGLTQAIYDACFLLFRSRTIAITIITILTFPGTVIHELSHLFTAEILGVHTGKLTLVPEGLNTEEIKTGSVMISQSDPFRRYAIGCAPLFVGLIAITAVSYAILQYGQDWGSWGIWGYWGGIYVLFAISSSMFSSREDLKGFIPFVIALAALLAAAYFAGLRIGLTGTLLDFESTLLDTLTKSLGIVLAINFGGFVLMKSVIFLIQKITRRGLFHRN